MRHIPGFFVCKFCDSGNHSSAEFCRDCQYPLKWTDGIAVHAPQTLIEVARNWHGGQTSGLYSVLSTGLIHQSKANAIESELRQLTRHVGKVEANCSLDQHLAAIEYLTAQLPEED